jgi:tol-pal system protein YbgF
MTATPYRWIPVGLALLLLLGGCTLGRARGTAGPQEAPSAATLTAEVRTLRQENGSLREQQRGLQARLDELQRTLAQSQEDQRRFHESMTTNFDLLEQSVALTLSKTLTADPMAGVQAREQNGARGTSVSAPAGATAAGTVGAPRVASGPPPALDAQRPTPAVLAAAPALAPSATTRERVDAGSLAVVPVVAMARTQEPAPPELFLDPDLLPPESPAPLKAHREAKPLYERGFALFARKDYDQALLVFQNFLQRFPNDIYSDNAQFWIGEAYLNLERGEDAEQAYRAVLRNYEHRSTLEGYKTPDAIYRLGQLAQRQGDARRTRHYFEVLSERFPDTSAGRRAAQELGSLGINTAAR